MESTEVPGVMRSLMKEGRELDLLHRPPSVVGLWESDVGDKFCLDLLR